ncbi:MAG: hypothetical protein LBT04_00650 [Prevotellaceae bacterium]|nr:hypothetical protein [Prevotellaceae bacterium]
MQKYNSNLLFNLTSTVKNHKALLFNDLPKQRATTLFNFRVIDKALNFGVFSLLDILFVCLLTFWQAKRIVSVFSGQ